MKIKVEHLFTISLLVGTIALGSCVDNEKNLRNNEQMRQEYENTFPVQGVDPNMDWKTIQSLKVSISVNEDWGTDYKVQVFDANPLTTANQAKLLSEGYANQDMNFETTIDCPSALDMVFVARVDAKGRYLIKPTMVKNGCVSVLFGKSKSATRAITRASEESKVPIIAAPYTTEEINNILSQATELSEEIAYGKIAVLKSNTTGYYKISSDLTLDEINGWQSNQPQIVVIDKGATLNVSQFASNNLCILIANGTVSLENSSVECSNGINFVIYKESKLTGKDLKFNDNSSGKINYNAGEIELKNLTFSGNQQGIFYNCGKVDIEHDLTSVNHQFTLVNRGDIEVGHDLDFGDNGSLESICAIDVKQNMTCKSLLIGRNSKVTCGSFTQDGSNLSMKLEPSSMLECEGTASFNRTFTGPSTTEEYALIQTKQISHTYNGTASGNIYFAVEKNANTKKLKELADMLAETDMGSFLCDQKKAPIIIPADKCTGTGYEPEEDGDDITIQPFTTAYAFEDNFPSPGDYDFNDIVLNVSTDYIKSKNTIKEMQCTIILQAIGATKQLGAGLRLIGLTKSDIKSISFEDTNNMRNTLKGSVFETTDMESQGNEVVIPLFGDAHSIYGVDKSHMVNTGKGNFIEPYKLKVNIVLNDGAKQIITQNENFDFFIAYKGGRSNKRTEIHLHNFRANGATAIGDAHEDVWPLANQITWAVSVPNFKYPKEGASIVKAYPDFEKWAQDPTTHLDWHQNPVEDNIY